MSVKTTVTSEELGGVARVSVRPTIVLMPSTPLATDGRGCRFLRVPARATEWTPSLGVGSRRADEPSDL
jgi:hypothetical protein